MKPLHFIFDTVKNTLKFRINKQNYKKCLDYFNCSDSLSLPSGKVFAQGERRYPDGMWYQFEKVGEPEIVWCEVRSSDLESFEETKGETNE